MASFLSAPSALLPTSSSAKNPSLSAHRSPLFGAYWHPSAAAASASPSRHQFGVRCQAQQQTAAAIIPREQRWMFEDSEINGPINAEKVAVSGKKRTQKLYRRHSGRPGGMKVETFDQLQKRIPERILEHAVRGMLPKGRLGRTLFTHLKVYEGPDHPHEAQQPVPLPIRDKRIQVDK